MNGPVEIRVTGLDHPSDVLAGGAQSPILSSVRPRPHHPGWDTAVWLDMGTLPVTPGFSQFYADMESWIWSHYNGWNTAVSILSSYDPHSVFSNPFLDPLLR